FLITRFNWYISSTDYKVDLVIPGSSFDSVRGLITPERLLSAKSKEEDNYTAGATKMLDPVSINVSVELGKARVSMRDVVEIGVGDVIRLDRSVDNLLEIKVQDKTKFYGRPGMVGNQIAIQITERAQDAPQTAVEQETPEQDVDFGG
ncbi:MAG TPA: FliM/FliN family flagellar motor C-terminal domain-containing protein, partial [Armatimonadota bacterium]|nr:FliM/FliN family flagellar motor C-terminal domain-containing protein [Armatimonadota bacterium]